MLSRVKTVLRAANVTDPQDSTPPKSQESNRGAAIMVPERAIIDLLIELLNGPFDGVRLMEVRYGGEVIMMFTKDMETHTEKIAKAETA
jgi:hypothetical protein